LKDCPQTISLFCSQTHTTGPKYTLKDCTNAFINIFQPHTCYNRPKVLKDSVNKHFHKIKNNGRSQTGTKQYLYKIYYMYQKNENSGSCQTETNILIKIITQTILEFFFK
jgi:hypothetical protein